MATIKGGCVCGKVTYSGTAEPIFAGICHCKTCQKASGTAFNTVVAVPADAIKISGQVTQFDGVGDSGKATHRCFCPSCGTSVAQSADVMPGVLMLTVGTLEDSSWVKPAMQIYCDSAQPWAVLPGMQAFPKMPMPPG
ncbi:MAG: GFA family protein [Acetobacteraceae bacterium]|nr:GFA family protein [Pseudomonadota bacterium]